MNLDFLKGELPTLARGSPAIWSEHGYVRGFEVTV